MRTAIPPGYPGQVSSLFLKAHRHGIAVGPLHGKAVFGSSLKGFSGYAMLMRNSCPWLPLHGGYGCAHALGTGKAVGWYGRMMSHLVLSLSPSHARSRRSCHSNAE